MSIALRIDAWAPGPHCRADHGPLARSHMKRVTEPGPLFHFENRSPMSSRQTRYQANSMLSVLVWTWEQNIGWKEDERNSTIRT